MHRQVGRQAGIGGRGRQVSLRDWQIGRGEKKDNREGDRQVIDRWTDR